MNPFPGRTIQAENRNRPNQHVPEQQPSWTEPTLLSPVEALQVNLKNAESNWSLTS